MRKKDFCGPVKLRRFRTLDKRWLLSLTSLPLGETRVREQAAESPFFPSLLKLRLACGATVGRIAPGRQAKSDAAIPGRALPGVSHASFTRGLAPDLRRGNLNINPVPNILNRPNVGGVSN